MKVVDLMKISMRKRIYPPTFITEFNLQGGALPCPHMLRDAAFEVKFIILWCLRLIYYMTQLT